MDQSVTVIRQHLIDPEICIRCNTCEATCPVGAITHDSRNYVVDAAKCDLCMACIPPCPTGSIDSWRSVPRVAAYSVADQLDWDELPVALTADELGLADTDGDAVPAPEQVAPSLPAAVTGETPFNSSAYNATVAPWSAAHPNSNLYGPKAAEPAIIATVTGNVRVTQVGKEYDTHHIVLDFATMPFPVLEGQSIGINMHGHEACRHQQSVRCRSSSRARRRRSAAAATQGQLPHVGDARSVWQ